LLKKSYSQAFKGFHATENPMTLLCMHVFFLQENIVQNYPSREEYATLLRYSKEILVFLKSHHVTLALCSNQKEDFLKKEVSSCHSAEFFDSIRGVKALIAPKPSVDLLMHSLRDLNLPHSPPESVWFVGDSFSDQEAARGMNLPFIGLGLEFNHHKKDTSYFFNNRDLYYFLKQQW
jgi:phosphoglycolate phosphatase-like HAD superfamily hydrolase